MKENSCQSEDLGPWQSSALIPSDLLLQNYFYKDKTYKHTLFLN